MNNFKANKLRHFLITVTAITILSMATTTWAESFWRTGTINRTLTDHTYYGGCMVHLSVNIGNGCPSNGWVSFDCDAKYSDAGEGQRAYASALVAFSMGKQVSVLINNAQKHHGLCVARRLDIIN